MDALARLRLTKLTVLPVKCRVTSIVLLVDVRRAGCRRRNVPKGICETELCVH